VRPQLGKGAGVQQQQELGNQRAKLRSHQLAQPARIFVVVSVGQPACYATVALALLGWAVDGLPSLR